MMLNIALIILMLAIALLAYLQARHARHRIDDLEARLQDSETRHQELEDSLEHCRSRDRQLVQGSGEALFIFDQQDGSLLEVNRQAEDLLGYTQGEVANLTFKILFSKNHRQRLMRMLSRAIREGAAEVDEIKFRRKDGSQFIGDVKVRTGRINNKQIIFGSFRDISQVIRLQDELKRQNRHLTLLNEISQRVAEGHDLQTTLTIILDEVIQSLAVSGGGIFLAEQSGTEMKLVFHRNIPQDVVDDLSQMRPGMGLAGKVIETGRPRMSTNLKKDHRRVSAAVFKDNWQAFLAVPFIAEEETLGTLFIFDRGNRVFSPEDIRLIQAIGRQLGPLLKNAELFDELQWQHRLNYASMRELERSRASLHQNLEQLEQNHRALQSLSQMKNSFLSLASHELRTPLTTVLSGAEFLQGEVAPRLDDDEAKALDVIMHGSLRLNHIIDELLEMTRLEAKTVYMAREAFHPELIFEELVREYQPKCEARKLTLKQDKLPGRAKLRGDFHHLRKAFGRLVENAIKFTPEQGLIELSGQVLSEEQIGSLAATAHRFNEDFFNGPRAAEYLELTVQDNGIGLKKEDQLRIFDKFHEVGDISTHSTSRQNFGGKGLGLGLALAKGIIEMHDGLIWVRSNGPGQGSRFSVLLPLASDVEEHDATD